MNDGQPQHDADLIILGGGCAGLSLATRLARQSPTVRTLVLEPRTRYTEDRTWCGWRLYPHPFADCVSAEWDRWRIRTPLGNIDRGSKEYPYEMIDSGRFYQTSADILATSTNVTLMQGTAAANLHETADHVDIVTEEGRTLSAPYVIDTRPRAISLSHPWLWQNFVGYVIDVKNASTDTFPDMPTLMDFQAAGDCVAQFMYIVPAGDHRFLCEWTQFAREPGRLAEIEAKLNLWLETCAPGFRCERRESGSLPMALAPPAASTRVVPAGTRGGSMRASTGYAFHAIQRWADECASSIAATAIPTAPRRSSLLDAMDILFLRVLQQKSTSAEKIFSALFRGAPPDSLVRFLAGQPTAADLWPVVRGLPWSRFIGALPGGAVTWLAS